MEYNGKEINTLKELEELIVKEINIKELLDKLDAVPKQIKELVSTQQSNLTKLRELIDFAEKINNPTTKENLIAVTKEMFQLLPNQDAIAELLLKQNKKTIVKKAKEAATDGLDLIKHIKSFYDSIIKVDIFGTEKEGKAIAKKLKKIFGNGNFTKGSKIVARNVGLSVVLAAFSSVILGYPIGSLEYFGITAVGSATAGALTAKKSKERINNLVNKLKKK